MSELTKEIIKKATLDVEKLNARQLVLQDELLDLEILRDLKKNEIENIMLEKFREFQRLTKLFNANKST